MMIDYSSATLSDHVLSPAIFQSKQVQHCSTAIPRAERSERFAVTIHQM